MPGPGRILIVDDERLMSMALQHQLTHDGHQVEVAGSLEEALSRLAGDVFDVVVADLRPEPHMDVEVVRSVHAAQPGAAIIVLMHAGEPTAAAAALRSGAAVVLGKPCALGDVTRETRRVLRRPAVPEHAV